MKKGSQKSDEKNEAFLQAFWHQVGIKWAARRDARSGRKLEFGSFWQF